MKDPKKNFEWVWGKRIHGVEGEFIIPQIEPEGADDAIDDAWRMQAKQCTIKMSVGRSRNKSLSVNDARAKVEHWLKYKDAKHIKVEYHGQDNRVTVLDLMEERMYNWFVLEDKGDELIHERIIEKMVKSHLERLDNYRN